jgi:hypothetical protein
MRLFRLIALCLVLCVAPALPAQQQPPRAPADSVVRQVIHTRDGSTLVGRIVAEDSASIRVETSGGVLMIARANVASVQTIRASDIHNGDYWFPDPNRTRLMFGPTARMLDAGEGYYTNTYLVLQSFAGGLSKYVTVGGGFSLIPGVDPSEWLYYVTPKVSVYQSAGTNVAVGALAGFLPKASTNGFGVLYGVATQGGPNASVTAGAGYGFAGSSVASHPMFMLGGDVRVSRRVALLTENYLFTTTRSDIGCVGPCPTDTHGIVSYGLRFLGEKLSVDFAFFNAPGDADWIFPGIPYVSFSAKF